LIAVGGTNPVARLFDTATGRPEGVLVGHEDTIDDLAFSPDGARIATASWDATVRVWDRSTQRTLQILRGHNGRVFAVTFSPDGSRIVSGSDDTTLRIWDATTGEALPPWRFRSGISVADVPADALDLAGLSFGIRAFRRLPFVSTSCTIPRLGGSGCRLNETVARGGEDK